LAVVAEPVYIPYGVADAEQEDEESADRDAPDGYAPNVGQLSAPPVRHAGNRNPVANADAAGQSDKPVAQQPPTVLVFKDGHRTEVFNYAVVGDTLFDFAPDRTHKIQLADLDLSATQKTNEERGVDFQIPTDAAQ
jgi:hypothetical protein